MFSLLFVSKMLLLVNCSVSIWRGWMEESCQGWFWRVLSEKELVLWVLKLYLEESWLFTIEVLSTRKRFYSGIELQTLSNNFCVVTFFKLCLSWKVFTVYSILSPLLTTKKSVTPEALNKIWKFLQIWIDITKSGSAFIFSCLTIIN